MNDGSLDGAVENLVKMGCDTTKYFLDTANFKVIKNGNGSGYILYQKWDEYFLFRKKGECLESSMNFKDPKIINFLKGVLN
ncbi:hypothetical protein J4411_03035 [Candidatus Pacearchaeota archaeon]|nr:hypothetical protein [Candidatus Pacearchaeota archaeon]